MSKFKTLGLAIFSLIFILGLFACGGSGKVTLKSIEITSQPNKLKYIEGEQFNASGMSVNAVYSDGSKERITLRDFTISPDGPLTVNDKKITLTYKNKTAQIDISVVSITNLAIDTPPNKTQYSVGEEFNPAGMIVKVYYSDNTNEKVNDYTISPTGPLTTDVTSITITYKNKTATVNISVIEIQSISVTTPPTKTQYTEGDTFNPEGMVVTATLSDNSTLALTNYQISPTGVLDVENTEITISAGGKTAKVQITVAPAPVKGTPIATVEDFMQVYDNLDKDFYLTADIDFEGASINRIGAFNGPGFSGTFDGRGHALMNFIVENGNEGEINGRTLFARLEASGVIKNLAIINGSAIGRALGLLVGYNCGTIKNCYLEGYVSNTDWNSTPWGTGGTLFGRHQETGVIKNCVTNVTTASNAGCHTFGGYYKDTATFINNFAVADNVKNQTPLEHMVRMPAEGAAAGVPTSVPGNFAFLMANIESVDFSTLPSVYWDINPGQLPELKVLD